MYICLCVDFFEIAHCYSLTYLRVIHENKILPRI